MFDLLDCLNHTISVFYNKDTLIPIHKKHITFIEKKWVVRL